MYIEGRIRTRKWTDQAGVEKYSTEIVVEQMQMLGGRASPERNERSGESFDSQDRQRSANRPPASRPGQNRAPSVPAGGGFDEMEDDDITVLDQTLFKVRHLADVLVS